MQATGNLPDANHVFEIVGRLFGDETLVKQASSPFKVDGETIYATYVGDDGTTRALLVCDIAFAVRAGASLTMIPPGTAEESIQTKDIPDNLFDNLGAILNICVNLFMDAFTDPLRLGATIRDSSELDDNAKAVLESSQRADFDIDIPRYGEGKMTLLIS